MDNVISWTEQEEAIIATNTDATECKRCAVELGYWKDDYISFFVKHTDRKAPEINRGYYARVKAMEMFIHQFLERCDTKCQIINLGCGFDTLFWRLKDMTQAVENFIELDFPAVVAKKGHIIKRNKQLLEKISNEDGEVIIRSGDLHGAGYHLMGCDLRCLSEVQRKLSAGGWTGAAPTLVLAECVLVYLRPDAAAALLRHLAAAHARAVVLVYEQCNLSDKFGEVMVRNLSARGCGSLGGVHGAAPAAHAARLAACGWERAAAWDMRAVWAALPDDDRARVLALEMLDEAELLHQLNSHYALAVGSRGAAFHDIDLNA